MSDQHTGLSPEERRDAAIAAVIAAGGSVVSAVAMATAEDPGTVVAYHLSVADGGSPAVAAALTTVRAQTETDLAGLVPWIDPDMVVRDEWIEDAP